LLGFPSRQESRVRSTDDAIERELMFGGFVARYPMTRRLDGLPAGEDMFVPCSFWLADNLASQRRNADGEALFEPLLPLRNDVLLPSKEYDPRTRRQLGNFSRRCRTSINQHRAQLVGGRPDDARTATLAQQGKTAVYVVVEGKVAAAIALADVVRPESRAAVDELKRTGIQRMMLTGDSCAVAETVAAELGLNDFFAEGARDNGQTRCFAHVAVALRSIDYHRPLYPSSYWSRRCDVARL
jgi:hypothetical protein